MYLEKMYVHVCACIWRTELNYLENKNGLSWVQRGWTICNWGKGREFTVELICGSKTLGDDFKQNLLCHSKNKIVVRWSCYASNKNGDDVTLQNWVRFTSIKKV